MTITETIMRENETPERAFLIRTFEAKFSLGDGRTVDARIVPWNVRANVSDDGGRTIYPEEWAPESFDEQLVAGHRLKVLLNFEHRPSIADVVGKCLALRSMPDGLHGTFRMSDTRDGDKALELINDGILDSVSLEALPKRNGSVRTAQGVIRRVRAHLRNVALCREGAFADARVLAVREAPDVMFDEELLPVAMDPELVERCRRLGIELPQRYQAHPDKTDTPAETGTSEDGTRHTDNVQTEET